MREKEKERERERTATTIPRIRQLTLEKNVFIQTLIISGECNKLYKM